LRRLAEPVNAAPLFRGLYAWALLHAEPATCGRRRQQCFMRRQPPMRLMAITSAT
jgi:hypothetical protein